MTQSEYVRNGIAASPERLPVSDLFSLRGKTAICTGSTGGIGKELCLTLAEAGCDIVSMQLPEDPALPSLEHDIKALGRRFSSFECDIGNSQHVRSCFGKIWAAGIEADVLFNGAGTNRRGNATDMTDADIDLVSVKILHTIVCKVADSPRGA